MMSKLSAPPSPAASTAKQLAASLFLLLTGIFLDIHNSGTIQQNFPDRQPIPDLLFLALPYIAWTQYISDLANIFSVVLLGIFIFPRNWRKLPFVFSILGLGYLLRSLMILLNPFGGPLGNVVHYGITTIHQFGQFPSGHTMLVVIIYLLLPQQNKALKRLALLGVIVEVIVLLLSHGHYSIDIIGGWLVGYFSYKTLQPHESALTIKKD